MKVKVEFEAKAYFRGEIEMSQQDYDKWCKLLDNARGAELEDFTNDLFDACRFNYSDPTDWDEPECTTFESVPIKAKRR